MEKTMKMPAHLEALMENGFMFNGGMSVSIEHGSAYANLSGICYIRGTRLTKIWHAGGNCEGEAHYEEGFEHLEGIDPIKIFKLLAALEF